MSSTAGEELAARFLSCVEQGLAAEQLKEANEEYDAQLYMKQLEKRLKDKNAEKDDAYVHSVLNMENPSKCIRVAGNLDIAMDCFCSAAEVCAALVLVGHNHGDHFLQAFCSSLLQRLLIAGRSSAQSALAKSV